MDRMKDRQTYVNLLWDMICKHIISCHLISSHLISCQEDEDEDEDGKNDNEPHLA